MRKCIIFQGNKMQIPLPIPAGCSSLMPEFTGIVDIVFCIYRQKTNSLFFYLYLYTSNQQKAYTSVVKKTDVPQEKGLLAGQREVNYAVDNDGNYTLHASVGWDAKTVALKQAWEEIEEQLQEVLETIKAGKKSPLAYHMINNQMDETLLAQYSGIARWRVKRHLKPSVFRKLGTVTLQTYSTLFGISVNELQRVPDNPMPHLQLLEQVESKKP